MLEELEAVLGEMIKVENAQQVERGLRTIIKMSEEVRDITKGRREGGGGDEDDE